MIQMVTSQTLSGINDCLEDTGKSSVLIVDDNFRNLQVLGGFLKNEGLSVEFAVDGESALSWLTKKKFDLILLDIMMPGMNGYEVCAEVKRNPETAEIPIIYITAVSDTESIIKGFNLGAVDYIAKPFIQEELLARVRTHLKAVRTKQRTLEYLARIQEHNLEISNSIAYAKNIQNAVLLTNGSTNQNLPDHFILNKPRNILSGDFHWINKIDDNIFFAVMDCTGHGVPGALMSILGATLLNEIIIHRKLVLPDMILEELRHKLITTLGQNKGSVSVKDGIEGSLISYNVSSSELRFAGTQNPLIHFSGSSMEVIKADRIPIGYYEKKAKFSLRTIQIRKGDTIYMFSDGFMDQFGGPDSRKIMSGKFRELLFQYHTLPLKSQKTKLFEYLSWWQQDLEQTDDILIVGIRF
jgi:phosphoserine phosphatase RsbU/P